MSQAVNAPTRTEESVPAVPSTPDPCDAIDAVNSDHQNPDPVDSTTVSRSRHLATLLRPTAIIILMSSIGGAWLAISDRSEFAQPPSAVEAEGDDPYQVMSDPGPVVAAHQAAVEGEGDDPYQVMSDPGPVVAAHQAAVEAEGDDPYQVLTWLRPSSCTRIERSNGHVDANGECLLDHPSFGDDVTLCASHFCAAQPGEPGAYLIHPTDFGRTS